MISNPESVPVSEYDLPKLVLEFLDMSLFLDTAKLWSHMDPDNL